MAQRIVDAFEAVEIDHHEGGEQPPVGVAPSNSGSRCRNCQRFARPVSVS